MKHPPGKDVEASSKLTSSSLNPYPLLYAIVGGILASVGLELFLHPNQIVVGGMTGVSALMSHAAEVKLGLFLLLLNVPLVSLYLYFVRKSGPWYAFPGLLAFAGTALLLEPVPALSEHTIIAAVVGGITLGFGAGLVARSGGLLDALELRDAEFRSSSRLIILRKSLSMEQIAALFQILVLSAAGLMLGWEQALYSAVACLAAFETARFMLTGLYRHLYVRTAAATDTKAVLQKMLHLVPVPTIPAGDQAALIQEQEQYNSECAASEGESNSIVYRVHVLDLPRFRAMIRDLDPGADIVFVRKAERL